MFLEPRFELLEVESQILNATFAKFDVIVANSLGDDRRVPIGDFKHRVGHIDTDYFSGAANNLRSNKADLSRSGSEIQNRLSFVDVLGGIAAAIVSLDDFIRNDLQIFFVVIDRAAQGCFLLLGTSGVTLSDRRFRHWVVFSDLFRNRPILMFWSEPEKACSMLNRNQRFSRHHPAVRIR